MNKVLVYFYGIFMLLRCGYCDWQCLVGTLTEQQTQLEEITCLPSTNQKTGNKLQFNGDEEKSKATDFCAIFAMSAVNPKTWQFSCDNGRLCSSESSANITGSSYIKQNVALNGTIGDIYCCRGNGCNGLKPAAGFLSSKYTQCPASNGGQIEACLNVDNCVSANAVTYEGTTTYKCDTSGMCAKYNISSGVCKKVSVASQPELLNICCCSGVGCVAKFMSAKVDSKNPVVDSKNPVVSTQATIVAQDTRTTAQPTNRSSPAKPMMTTTPKLRGSKSTFTITPALTTRPPIVASISTVRTLLYNSAVSVGQVTGVRQQGPRLLVSWWVVYVLVAILCVGCGVLVALFSLVIYRRWQARCHRPVVYAYSQLTADFSQNGRDNEDDFLLIG